jgi:hypothetical protein
MERAGNGRRKRTRFLMAEIAETQYMRFVGEGEGEGGAMVQPVDALGINI